MNAVRTWRRDSNPAKEAQRRLTEANENFDFALETHMGFESAETKRFVLEALDELDCASAAWLEWTA